jgi:hypothetical protein
VTLAALRKFAPMPEKSPEIPEIPELDRVAALPGGSFGRARSPERRGILQLGGRRAKILIQGKNS